MDRYKVGVGPSRRETEQLGKSQIMLKSYFYFAGDGR